VETYTRKLTTELTATTVSLRVIQLPTHATTDIAQIAKVYMLLTTQCAHAGFSSRPP
jgi:hypothetical protein